MSEHVHRSGVGEVVGGNVHRLHGGDRACIRAGDPLLERGEHRLEVGLVAQPGGHIAQHRRHLGAGLYEPEDVVDQQHHVLVLLVAEPFGHRQTGVADTEPGAGRLVHLSEHENRLAEHARLVELAVEFFCFAVAFTDAAEDADPLIGADHVVDELHDEHRLADPGTAEQPGLPAPFERGEYVDHLDPGRERIGAGRTPCQRHGPAMDRPSG